MFEKLRRAKHLRDLDERIRKFGWTAICVGAYEAVLTWAYTMGFAETLGQPEMIVFDAPAAVANGLFHRAFEELRSGALTMEDGKAWVVEGDRIGVWRQVHPSRVDADDWLLATVNRREAQTGERRLDVFQLVCADPDGRLPWEGGYDESLRPRQPALYLSAEDYEGLDLTGLDRDGAALADARGWAVMRIDAPLLKWAYTVGLSDTKLPELICFIPSVTVAYNLLADMQARVRSGEIAPVDGFRWQHQGFECCFRQVHESQYLALNAFFVTKMRRERRTGRREAVKAYQIFLPDRAGRYPWDRGCDRTMIDLQPPLFQAFDERQLRRGPLSALMRI